MTSILKEQWMKDFLNSLLGVSKEQKAQIERLRRNKGKGHRVVGRGTLVADAQKISESDDFRKYQDEIADLVK